MIPPVDSHTSVFSRLSLGMMGNAVSLGRFPLAVKYIYDKEYAKEHTVMGAIGNILLMPADMLGGTLFLQGLSGNPPSLGLSHAVSLLYIASYVPIAVDSVAIIASKKNCYIKKRQAMLDLAVAIIQIALAALALGKYNHWGILLLAGAAFLSGAASFVHRYHYSSRFNLPHTALQSA